MNNYGGQSFATETCLSPGPGPGPGPENSLDLPVVRWAHAGQAIEDAAALMRPIPPEAGHYRDKSAHPMDARIHPKGVRGPCCVR